MSQSIVLELGLATYSRARNVREVSCNTWGVDDIVEGELIHERAGLQKERKRLFVDRDS